MQATAEIDDVVRASLTDMLSWIREARWRGREREAVSLYSFGFLQKHFNPGQLLHNPAQIGIEVAVPGVGSRNRKKQVCKDLVIWAEPAMNCWDALGSATQTPLAILEWKVSQRDTAGPSAYDVDWLTRFSSPRGHRVRGVARRQRAQAPQGRAGSKRSCAGGLAESLGLCALGVGRS